MSVGLETLRQSGRLLKAQVVGYKDGQKLVACCPYHRESTPSFAVFGNGGFHCAGCGVSGHVSELVEYLDVQVEEGYNAESAPGASWASLEPSLLDQAHSIVLSQLALRGPQREALRRRGLTANDLAQLEAQGYRSAPTSWGLRRQVAEAVVAQLGEENAAKLPFLERWKSDWMAAGIEGLLVPLRNHLDQVVGFKVRKPNGTPKYLYWKAKGSKASTGAPVHVKRNPHSRLTVVVEGPIKADILALRWEAAMGEAVTVVAIPGASAYKDLVDVLAQLPTKRVLLALDQDAAGEKATNALRPRLVEAGFEVSVASWPTELGKVDDFILSPIAAVQLRREAFEEVEAESLIVSTPAFKSMEEARSPAREWLREAILGNAGVNALQLEMGGGKTWMTVDLVNELYRAGKLKGRQIGLFTARHEQAEQFPGTADWAKHHGFDYKADGEGFTKAPTEETPCKPLYIPLRLIASGAPMKLACDICPQKATCESNFARKPGEPFHLSQRNTGKELHLFNANNLRDKATIKGLTDIFLDDVDLERALVENVKQSSVDLVEAISWAHTHASYQPMAPLLEAILAVLAQIPEPRYQFDSPALTGKDLQNALAKRLGGLETLREVLAFALTAEDASPFDEQGRVRAKIPHRIFLEMARRLSLELERRDSNDWNPMVTVGYTMNPETRKIERLLSVWKRAEIDFTGKRVYLLNADQAAEQYQRLFPGAEVNVFCAPVEMPDRTFITQQYEGPFSRKRVAELTQLVIDKLEEREAAHPEESPVDWGVVSFPAVTEAVEKRFPGINARYYLNQTGSNELENVGFLVLAGDHRPNLHAFLEEARAVYGNDASINAEPKTYFEELRDRSGNVVKVKSRGYIDPRLDERWQLVSVGENRQGFGRARPWNTGNEEPEQGALFESYSAPKRHLEILVLSSYALPGIIPDLLIGERVNLEADLVAAALVLRRAGHQVTAAALKEKTSLSLYWVRALLDRVKLRSEQEFMALNAALASTPGLGTVAEVVFAPPLIAHSRIRLTCIASVVDSFRGPPMETLAHGNYAREPAAIPAALGLVD